MERAIYFDGWYKNNHCYHPSLPFRSMQMIDDIERYRGTLLVWSAMGGGSLSLPFLEHEAYGEVDPRLRIYGYMNDSEFIKECDKRGIKVFGIVFEVQGWEYPAVFETTDNGRMTLKQFNVLHDPDQNHDWYGLREFTQDKHWQLFGKKFANYFPDGLINSDGEPVSDLLWECCAKTFRNEPVHADWVEVKGHKQFAYQMCRNNPVWRDYMKKIIEIQIDAGVHGIQLDESELPMTSMYAGGCFCRDCMKGFREYLKKLKVEGRLSEALRDECLDTFSYADYIIKHDLEYPKYYSDVPLYRYYWDYQLRQVKKYFKEMVDYAKAYSLKTRDTDILVSGNFFSLMPTYYAMEPYADIIITEMKNTLFRQPAWYRFAAGFARDKPIIIAENPYGGIIPQLLELLNDGKGYDLYRLFLLEAAVYGCNMAVPYGGWMGNTIKDAFYPPRDVTVEIQNFIADKAYLFSRHSGSNVAVIWSYPSYYWREAVAGYSNNIVSNADNDILSYSNQDADNPNSSRLPFWEVVRSLSKKQICYDVVLTADDEMRNDDLTLDQLADYEVVVLPDCNVLTVNQVKIFKEFINSGGKLFIFGRVAENLNGVSESLESVGAIFCENKEDKTQAIELFNASFDQIYARHWQVRLSDSSLGLQIHRIGEGKVAAHILNYAYESAHGRVKNLEELEIEINGKIKGLKAYALQESQVQEMGIELRQTADGSKITLKNVPCYTVLEWTLVP